MSSARSLLDQFLGQVSGAQGSAVGGASDGGSQGAGAGGGLDLQGLLQGKGGLITGAAVGGLAGLLLGGKKTPRKIAGNVLKVGGIALVGGLAYKAYRDWQATKSAPAPAAPSAEPVALPSPEGTPFLPAASDAQEELSTTLIRAMIAAAKADGHVNDEERQRIGAQLEGLELDASDRAFIAAELEKPLDVASVAKSATTPELAAEIYAASLLAVDPEGPAEKGYLAMLAARLQLDPDLVAHLHANADQVAR
ncbi:MAG: tellurite resistance TerB family protein [Pseudomonadota bacterium]